MVHTSTYHLESLEVAKMIVQGAQLWCVGLLEITKLNGNDLRFIWISVHAGLGEMNISISSRT